MKCGAGTLELQVRMQCETQRDSLKEKDMSESKWGTQINIERFNFSVRLRSIFFPLELTELIPMLEEVGYSVRTELSQRIADIPFGIRAVAGGAIAEKRAAGQSFRLDPDRGVLAIAGKNVHSIIEDFSDLEHRIEGSLNVVLQKEALFYEFQAEGSANTGSDPTKVIARLFHDSGLRSEISRILGFSATNFGVRIVEQNRYVTDSEWFDFRIEPLIPKPNTTYHIDVVYRHPKRGNVVRQAKSLNKTIEKLLSVIEQEA